MHELLTGTVTLALVVAFGVAVVIGITSHAVARMAICYAVVDGLKGAIGQAAPRDTAVKALEGASAVALSSALDTVAVARTLIRARRNVARHTRVIIDTLTTGVVANTMTGALIWTNLLLTLFTNIALLAHARARLAIAVSVGVAVVQAFFQIALAAHVTFTAYTRTRLGVTKAVIGAVIWT